MNRSNPNISLIQASLSMRGWNNPRQSGLDSKKYYFLLRRYIRQIHHSNFESTKKERFVDADHFYFIFMKSILQRISPSTGYKRTLYVTHIAHHRLPYIQLEQSVFGTIAFFFHKISNDFFEVSCVY